MSTPAPPAASPLELLRARFLRLASDPRVRLLPDGAAIARECIALLDRIDELERRTSGLENAMVALVQHKEEFE